MSYMFLFILLFTLYRRDSKYNHVRIHTKSDGGRTKYFLTDLTLFDTIYDLVEHYKQSPLRSPRFEQILHHDVPRQDSHERQSWFHSSLDAKTAEDMLKRVRMDGAFLVRPSGQEAEHGKKRMWAITFRWVWSKGCYSASLSGCAGLRAT